MSTKNLYFDLWLGTVRKIPVAEWALLVAALGGGLFLYSFYELFSKYRLDIFHAFEKIKLRKKDLDREAGESAYFEITIPKDSTATAFQVQQKIIKAFHSVYSDPIDGHHEFSGTFYLIQKLLRLWKVARVRQTFFTMQIWAQYPYISFCLNVPIAFFPSMEKAIFNAYPNAEITMLDKQKSLQEIQIHQKSYLSYGQSTIEGKFYHRVKTFKDLTSDPVDSIISTMEGLEKGKFMVYNVLVSPASHFFNQVITYLIESEERARHASELQRVDGKKQKEFVSELASALKVAMMEKMKASLFQTIVSYWTISNTPEDAEAKLKNIQSVLNEINQKNMNTLRHRRLFTKQVEDLDNAGTLKQIIDMKPVLKLRKFWKNYTNYGQIVSDAELYAFWHLPNTTPETVSSIKIAKFKKRPASQLMRQYPENFYLNLGKSNFRMQEDTTIGIPTWDDMKKHVYILGGTGSGKSETLKTILSSVLQKEGAEKTACLIIDPKNDFATDLLTMIPEERKDDVVYFCPQKQKDKPLSFPFFSQFSGEKSNDERIEFLISIMRRFVQIDSVNSWGPELENILRQLFATAYILPTQSLSGLDLLLNLPDQVQNIVHYLPPRLQKFWSNSILKRTSNDLERYLATTNNKLGKFLDYPEFMNIVDRLETKITFEEMIKTGKIFIANLGTSSEQMKKYYSVYLSAHIAEAIFGQARLNTEDRKPTVFVIDEFQRVASDIFETLFSEVRAFNTSLVISNQFMGQLDERIQKSIESNISTKIFMRTQSVSDAEIAEKILGEKVLAEDIINLPTGTAYIKTLIQGVPQDAMSIKIFKTAHPTDITKDAEEFYLKQTIERYGTPLDVIKQKREAANNTYYSAKNPQIFQEQMSRQETFAKIVDIEVEDKKLQSIEPVSDIIELPIKTVFDI